MIVEMVFIPSICQSNALNAAVDPTCTRDLMASVYEDCLHCYGKHGKDSIDFKAINEAIVKRWPKGLEYIKMRAWKLAQSRRVPA